ncbi:MAG: GGDEF domain-containing protein, partial [Oscillospiraceae bacterium]|nr:GGDEF domain-containing protein [Oscillospiraceae bacterium]
LYDLSEIYFTLCNDTVAAVEKYTESQVTSMRKFLFIVDGIFLLVIISMIILMLYSEITKKRADNLGKLAYIDVITTMPNRASCEKLIAEIKAIPAENRVSLGLIMFDMNNLKLANDFLGHQGGDIIIKDFGLALKSLAEKHDIFAGRYGGDEFVMIFRGKTESLLKEITEELAVVIEERNKLMKLDVERIQYAYGFGYAPPEEEITIDELIFKADKNMYTYKKNMKNKKSINESE